MKRQNLARIGALISTVALSWGVLTVGFADESAGGPQVGEVAERDYRARRAADVEDVERTQAARDRAFEAVVPTLRRNTELETTAFNELSGILDSVATETQPVAVTLEPIPQASSTTSTTVASAETETTAEEAPAPGVITGSIFIDVNGDAVFDGDTIPEGGWTTDRPWAGIDVVAVADDGSQFRATTDRIGTYSIEVPQGDYLVLIDAESTGYPRGLSPSGDTTTAQEVACFSETCEAEAIGLTARFTDSEVVIDRIRSESPFLDETGWMTLVDYGQRDVYRAVFGQELLLAQVNTAAVDRLTTLFRFEVTADQLDAVQFEAKRDPTSVDIDDPSGRSVVNELVSVSVVANMVVDEEATTAAQTGAAEAVEPEMRTFGDDALIIGVGSTFTQFTIDAINATGANLDRTVRQAATGGLLAVLVGVLAYYLARFRRVYWDRPRMVTLFGMLIVLGAAAVRLSIAFHETSSWYVLPAVAFGYLASVLFDNRMGTLMAMALGVLALVGTADPGVGVYATLATLAPIGFVSSVSTRRAFRNSVLVSAVAAAVIAAACSWFFEAQIGQNPLEQIWRDAAWAGAVALIASLVALAAMPFFESMFDITTTLRLLELTDRNHEALQVLQSKAFGTFNHSLMVGTLADAAAKAIGANNILARAAAYYHDLGKTENPQFFIENQFASANPHDDLPPEESARIVRQHVLDGVELARRFNIPSEVAEGIVSHHGDGIMRYFYEKARQRDGDTVDPDLFRHAGHKPQTREMAILMMSDAVEGACRAVFADEEPKPESIAKVVNRVVDEKVADGQLAECDLTLGELSTVRRAFIDALTGHYHQRIPYPNFPGS